MKLTDKQKEEVDRVIYEQVQESLDDLSVFEDYWHGMTCSDGTLLNINIYNGPTYGNELWWSKFLQCVVYFAGADMIIDYSNPVLFESKHLRR